MRPWVGLLDNNAAYASLSRRGASLVPSWQSEHHRFRTCVGIGHHGSAIASRHPVQDCTVRRDHFRAV